MSNKRKREFSIENIEKASNDELHKALYTIVREQHWRKRLVEFVECTKEELKTIDEPWMVVNDDIEKIGYFKGYNALTEHQKKRVNAFGPCCYKYGQPCNILNMTFENGEWFNKTEAWKECQCEESVNSTPILDKNTNSFIEKK